MIQRLTNVAIDYNDDDAYISKYHSNRKHNPRYGIGRGRAEMFGALGNEVIAAPQDQVLDSNPGIAPGPLNERRSAGVFV